MDVVLYLDRLDFYRVEPVDHAVRTCRRWSLEILWHFLPTLCKFSVEESQLHF